MEAGWMPLGQPVTEEVVRACFLAARLSAKDYVVFEGRRCITYPSGNLEGSHPDYAKEVADDLCKRQAIYWHIDNDDPIPF